jgi:cytoskeletal protein RodZ
MTVQQRSAGSAGRTRRRKRMSKKTGAALLGLLLIVFVLGLTACNGEDPTTVAQATTSAPEPSEPEPTAPPPTEAATNTPEPTDEPTDTPIPATDTPIPATNTPEVVDDSACITCHTSQETLEALAVEEEDPGEELSEGEG